MTECLKEDRIRTADLFECDTDYISPLFECEYPWEMLPKISDHIQKLLREGIPGFRLLKEGVLVGENVRIAPTATVDGPAVIGPDTEILPGAFVRWNVITGPGCTIGNSTELKNCVLLRRATVPHYNYVGDSVLGVRAHMGAGAVCSNLKADGRNVVIHGIRDYETGLRKIGAILGDGADIGCGCVLNPGTVIGKNTSVYPLTATRGVYPAECIVKSVRDVVVREKRD